jgi:hypothetical protein
MYCRSHRNFDSTLRRLAKLAKAGLLFDLVGLLTRLLLSLPPVLQCQVKRIVRNLQLGADHRFAGLDYALGTLGLLVLILVRPDYVNERAECNLLQFLGVLFDDGNVGFKLGKGVVAELVGAGQVGGDVGVGCAQVGVEGRDEGVVSVVEEGERFGAVRVRLVELD